MKLKEKMRRSRASFYKFSKSKDYKVRQRPLPTVAMGSLVRTCERVEEVGSITETATLYENETYGVAVYEPDKEGITCVTVQRKDGKSVHDWRDLQQIKSDLFGAEREALELYPAESRKIDTANTYWLWVLPEKTHASIGIFGGRLVTDVKV